MSALQAAPPETERDQVRMLVAAPGRPFEHTDFLQLADQLDAGDLLVVNASATLPAALPATRADGTRVDVHLSTPDPADESHWVVEIRRAGRRAQGHPQETLTLPAGGRARLLAPYLERGRLWTAELDLPAELHAYLHAHGAPIRYLHDPKPRPLAEHQTIFATVPGSAEMPSAGRPFTTRALTRLREHGISVQRIVLHTGVSSQERGELPYPERYEVSAHTAARVNAARAAGHRVIAVGTTVVRALETVAEADGTVHAGRGWTSVVVTPRRGVRAIDGLLTGWHDPEASHLLLLEAVAGRDVIARSYAERGYRRHEFGDVHLLLR